MKTIKIQLTADEARAMLELYENKEAEQVKELGRTREQITKLRNYLGIHHEVKAADAEREKTTLPEPVAGTANEKRKKYFNWKETARNLIIDGKELMSTDLAYETVKPQLSELGIDRDTAIRSFSSAYYYLCKKDNVLEKTSVSNYNGYLYGLKEFFENGQIKEEYKVKLRKRGIRL